ncbi:DNA-formamidopyrimidine glycosylase family protein [Corynebacterium macclintockiae]|uniref:DNA-formamidopyrimidine glycosylase family protein n=1 Tax=Corynebacterium macclintockiae TaxID=2913501 RepID=UPI00254C30EC|nr:DNA-formamidopyrimidine glycosylase family protein [Corynebacterium macclintockiae]MDK8890204.1 DNA-formamidopyrimidine glycosylase family protein [Corynebacterium macclintockiae]
MPEGDSVLQLSNRLQWMAGRTVRHTDIRVPRFATLNFDGEKVHRVWPYGKHLFMHIGQRVIHTHLKMEGVWAIHRAGQRWRRPGHTARIVLRFSPQHADGPEIEIVGHSLGFVRVFRFEDYPQVVAHLGPDILAEDWTVSGRDEAIARIMQRPDRSFGAALLDQKNVAGIGNEYRAEVMFLVGMHPKVTVGEAGEGGVQKAIDLARRVMWDNRLEPHRVFTGDRRPGQGTWVFGRAGKACRRCGTAIQQATLGGRWAGGDPEVDAAELERIIWWCPQCQRE